MCNTKFAANYLLQSYAIDKLRDRQPADRNNQARLQDSNFIGHPGRAIVNLIRRWNTVGAAGILSGETPADRREINSRSNGCFIHSAKLFEPAKKRFPSRVRERPFQRRFPRTGRLSDDHHVAHDRFAGDRRRLHARALSALQECPHMPIQSSLNSCCSHGPVGRSHIVRQRARRARTQARGYGIGRKPTLKLDFLKQWSFFRGQSRSENGQRRKIERRDKSKLSTMLMTMQVTMGK